VLLPIIRFYYGFSTGSFPARLRAGEGYHEGAETAGTMCAGYSRFGLRPRSLPQPMRRGAAGGPDGHARRRAQFGHEVGKAALMSGGCKRRCLAPAHTTYHIPLGADFSLAPPFRFVLGSAQSSTLVCCLYFSSSHLPPLPLRLSSARRSLFLLFLSLLLISLLLRSRLLSLLPGRSVLISIACGQGPRHHRGLLLIAVLQQHSAVSVDL